MTTLGSYRVSVQTRASGPQTALLTPARVEDMPTDWTFDWPGLWQRTDFSSIRPISLPWFSRNLRD